jgi:undecaprenyl-diphosphatase
VPVSSSAHLAIVPRVLGWRYAGLDPGERKTFEVALHAGSAPALTLVAAASGSRLRPAWLALTVVPPAVAGLVLERPIERRLGGPRSVALTQVAAGAALWAADRRPARRSTPNAADHISVGIGQALSLAPGVSRAGAALTAGRLRGLTRPAAAALALQSALPVTAGAMALKGFRLARAGGPGDALPAMAAGAGASLAAGLAAGGLLRRLSSGGSYAPLAVYRVAFGAAVLAGVRAESTVK